MTSRPYVSRVRAAAAEAKRERAVAAAAEFLRREPMSAFSLESVAKVAGVTRLTLYNQFGSRRGLLEAVFDHLASLGRLNRIAEAVTVPDARQGLEQLVEIFCDFWSGDAAVGRLHDAMGSDDEFALALMERNERRRLAVLALVERLPDRRADPTTEKDVVDLIYALLSYPMFRLLATGRSPAQTRALLKAACKDALARLLPST